MMSGQKIAALSVSVFVVGLTSGSGDCSGCATGGSITNGDCYGLGNVDGDNYNIYGCHGSFFGGMDDNSVDNICIDGYHVCRSASEVNGYGLTSDECNNIGEEEIFFLRESSSHGCECSSSSKISGTNNIWACGGNGDLNKFSIDEQCQYIGDNDKFENCQSLTHVCGYNPKKSYDTSILNTGTNTDDEYNQIELSDANHGGVLCCKDQVADPCDELLGTRMALYRWYHGTAYNHFYTTNTEEPNEALGYTYEDTQGYLWTSEIESVTIPLYRYYDPLLVDHFYTTSYTELGSGSTGNSGWYYEGIAGYIMDTYCPDFNTPLYRYWAIGVVDHFYTIDYNELSSGNGVYQYEGIAGYVATM